MATSAHSKHRKSTNYVALGCVGLIAGFGSPASAQDASPTRLEGVLVTDDAIDEEYKVEGVQSFKATAPLLDTPRTVSVVTGEVLRNSASFSFDEALRNVPGITLGAGEGGTASADIPFIRGSNATSDTFVDGARDVGSQTRDTFAVERIEVFKGPNTAFGGRGGAGGTINIVSKLPQAESFVIGQASVGTADLKRLTLDVNQQIGGTAAIRINGLWHDSYVAGRDEVFVKRWGLAPSISLGVGTDTVGTLSYYHYETDGMPDYGLPYTSREQLNGTGVPDGTRVPVDVDHDNFYGLLSRDFQKTKVDSATFQFEHVFDSGWAINNTTRWSRARNDYIVTNPDDSAGNIPNGLVWRAVKSRNSANHSFVSNLGLSGEFNTGSMEHSLSLGGEMTSSDTKRFTYSVNTGDRTCPETEVGSPNYNCTDLSNPDPNDPWVGSVVLNTTPTETSADSIGIYAFDTITITPRVLVNLGVRWERFDVTSAGAGRGGPFDVGRITKSWSYQAGLIYKPSDVSSIYVSVANSATPPGTDVGEGSSAINGNNDAYEPLRTRNYEIGVKHDALDGALSLSAALFRTKKSDVRQIGPGGETIIIPGQERLNGLELGVAGAIGPVSLSGGYVYLDSKIINTAGFGTAAGQRFANTAKHNLSLWSNIEITDKFSIGGGAYYTSERFAQFSGNLTSLPGYWRFDTTASYQITDNVGLRANIQNITDERYYKKSYFHFAVPAPGRQAMLTLSARY